jgi:hypothetical protein
MPSRFGNERVNRSVNSDAQGRPSLRRSDSLDAGYVRR